jgi:hypothetical protein
MDTISMLWQFGILAAVLVFGIKLGLAVGLANLSKKYLATVCAGYGAGVLILAEISSHYANEITDLIYTYNSLFFIIMAIIMILAVIGCGPIQRIGSKNSVLEKRWKYSYFELVFLGLVFVYCMVLLAAGTYNPFIYFRF